MWFKCFSIRACLLQRIYNALLMCIFGYINDKVFFIFIFRERERERERERKVENINDKVNFSRIGDC